MALGPKEDPLARAQRASRGNSPEWIWIEGARAIEGSARSISIEAIVTTPGAPPPRDVSPRVGRRVPVAVWKGRGRGPFRAETPQGVGALARRPAPLAESDFFRARRFLVLDGVQIPGNVGALVRTAVALGVERVIALGDTADPLGPLSLRASAGYAVALPVLRSRHRADVFDRLSEGGAGIVSASARSGAWPPPRLDAWALVLGSEARGAGSLPEGVRLVTIPIARGVESLGVAAAGAILLAALVGEGAPG